MSPKHLPTWVIQCENCTLKNRPVQFLSLMSGFTWQILPKATPETNLKKVRGESNWQRPCHHELRTNQHSGHGRRESCADGEARPAWTSCTFFALVKKKAWHRKDFQVHAQWKNVVAESTTLRCHVCLRGPGSVC